MNCDTLNNDISFGTIFLIYFDRLHSLQGVHSIDYLSYNCVDVVKLALPVINDIELAFVRVWMFLRHCHHATTIKLYKYSRLRDLL